MYSLVLIINLIFILVFNFHLFIYLFIHLFIYFMYVNLRNALLWMWVEDDVSSRCFGRGLRHVI